MLYFLTTLTYWHWFGLGVALLIIELVVANTGFLLWISVSSIFVGVLLYIFSGLAWSYQFLIFALTLIVCTVIGRKYFHRHPIKSNEPTLNKRAIQYVGRTFMLISSIENGRGTIKVDDSIWHVSGSDLPVGTKVRVVGTQGTVLKVERAE